MKIAISTESTVDLTKELIERFDIKTVPFQILLGNDSYLDGEITTDEIINFVNENKILPKTGAVNDFQYEEHFANILKDYDAIIHFSISGEMSSAYNNALRVSKKYKNVYVVDTRTLSTGIALLAIYARKLADEGIMPDVIYNKCLSRVSSVQASFVLQRLDYLYKGGRCNAVSYFAANVFHIRPQIIVKQGKMISGKKYRGNFGVVVNKYCQDVLAEFNNPDLSVGFVTYTTCEESIIKDAVSYLENQGFKEIYVTRAGGTITSHCGENCLGILYINDAE